MKFIMNMSLRKTALQIIRGMAVDATLGATCGALYGFVFGGLGAIVHDEVGRLVVIAGYLGWCGAVAGALVGACGAILNSAKKRPILRRFHPRSLRSNRGRRPPFAICWSRASGNAKIVCRQVRPRTGDGSQPPRRIIRCPVELAAV